MESSGPPRLLAAREIDELLSVLGGWTRDGDAIARTFRFANFDQTMDFVNAVAGISRRADHHPDLFVGYDQCKVTYTTHSVKGLSQRDFDCAAKVDALFSN
jgi:4a-hydroxytetrahydrobiopterin dehydratase